MDNETITIVTGLATLISSISTVVLVGVTLYYAIQTRLMVKEMEKGRQITERTLGEAEEDRKLTKQTLEELQTGRQMSLLPIMTCDVITKVVSDERAQLSGRAKYEETKRLHIVITNVGNAPGFGTKLRVELKNAERSGWLIQMQDRNLFTLAADGKVREIILPVNTSEITIGDDKENPKIDVLLSYGNLYGKQFSTRLLLETNTWQFLAKHPVRLSLEVEWTKLYEVSRPEP
jgi:hypothetical protein